MKILALDIASKTGWCLYEGMGRGVDPRVRCGSWKWDEAGFAPKAEGIGRDLDLLLASEMPIAYAAIETPLRIIPTKDREDLAGSYKAAASTPETIGILHAMAGSAINSLVRRGVPYRLVPPVTWRTGFVGVSRAPASVAKKDGSKYLKHVVRKEADRLGLQYGFYVKNNDISDAVGIAWWLKSMVLRFQAEDALRAKLAA